MAETARQSNLLNASRIRACGVALCCVLLALCCLCARPQVAFASYADYSSDSPAAQDLNQAAADGLAAMGKTLYSGAMTGSEIVSGTYTVPAYSSSRMCIFYATLEDATAKKNPNQATITVSGGTITASFYLSGAYNAVYFGSAEEAASLAPEGGLTPSDAYFVDVSDSYSVGHGPFNVQISALNMSFDFAAFNGASKGIANGLWYSRAGVFLATTDFAATYGIGGSGGDTPTPDPSPSPSPDSGGDSSSDSGSGTGSGGSSSGASAGSSTASNSQTQEETPAASTEQTEVSATAPRGQLITIAGTDEEATSTQQVVVGDTVLDVEGITPAQIMAIAAAALVVLGSAFALLKFRLGFRKPSEPSESPGDDS